MDGLPMDADLSPEEAAEVQRVFEVMRKATEAEVWRMARLMVSKKDHELFGRTEFQLRDHLLRMGAQALEATVNDRKKGGTKVAATSAPTAARTRDSRVGDRGPS